MNNRTKRQVVVRSFSIEPGLLAEAQALAKMRGYRYSFSAWVSDVIRKEMEWLRQEKPQAGARS